MHTGENIYRQLIEPLVGEALSHDGVFVEHMSQQLGGSSSGILSYSGCSFRS
jgi:hypothetical protein